ncbi:SlyX family protein [Gilvimarinus agarilyticus]|uniref:SlyX family protein n=1 Tax=Gilvimarinus agarilyticus TaxID=679259 RepID=UPI000698CCAA|nr:SlyX family protein [Gilvimarinus agarilyticus]
MSHSNVASGGVSQDELIELQSRISFQEDTINELNLIVARQDRQLQALAAQLAAVVKKFDDSMYAREQGGGAADERPPHY